MTACISKTAPSKAKPAAVQSHDMDTAPPSHVQRRSRGDGAVHVISGRPRRAGTPSAEKTLALVGAPDTGMHVHAALTELARLLGRRAARHQRNSLGLTQAALAPVLLLVALAFAAVVLSLNIALRH